MTFTPGPRRPSVEQWAIAEYDRLGLQLDQMGETTAGVHEMVAQMDQLIQGQAQLLQSLEAVCHLQAATNHYLGLLHAAASSSYQGDQSEDHTDSASNSQQADQSHQ